MRLIPSRLPGPLVLQPAVHGDARGFFQETYRRSALESHGIIADYVQDNHSRSGVGVVRGMHFQRGMAKLVRCARGEIVDVLVDIRRGSPTFGEWEAFQLSDKNHHVLYCPDGFAHGFCVLSDVADVLYKTSTYWDPDLEGGFAHDDPGVGIRWPTEVELRVSDRDASAPRLSEIAADLPFEFVDPVGGAS